MNGLLALAAIFIFAGVVFLLPDVGPTAVLVCLAVTLPATLTIYGNRANKSFLLQLFTAALLTRIVVGTLIYLFQLQEFFGGDALTYDFWGNVILNNWYGKDLHLHHMVKFWFVGGGWGMLYLVAGVYWVVGRNPLAVQFISAVTGASTVPIIYYCAEHIFRNTRVARISALLAALYPSLILWSSQGLKDGPIIFLLTLIMLSTLKLGNRFSIKYVMILALSLLGILSLRFYVFYMVVLAVGGSFLIGMRAVTATSMVRQLITIVIIGLAMTYFGVLRTANTQLETFGSLQQVQASRLDQVQAAKTGFGKDVDVSTTSGALSAIPVGMIYLLFAPFPWQLASLRQSLTLPEMLFWWSVFPLFMLGLWFSIKYYLRASLPILIFSAMLTLSYSIFQGNIGTAYRQRSQLLIFYFMFAAAGYVLLKELKEDRKKQGAVEAQPIPPQLEHRPPSAV